MQMSDEDIAQRGELDVRFGHLRADAIAAVDQIRRAIHHDRLSGCRAAGLGRWSAAGPEQDQSRGARRLAGGFRAQQRTGFKCCNAARSQPQERATAGVLRNHAQILRRSDAAWRWKIPCFPVLGGDLGKEEYGAEFIARRIVHFRSSEPRPASFHGHPAHHVVILGILCKQAK